MARAEAPSRIGVTSAANCPDGVPGPRRNRSVDWRFALAGTTSPIERASCSACHRGATVLAAVAPPARREAGGTAGPEAGAWAAWIVIALLTSQGMGVRLPGRPSQISTR